MQFLKPTNCTSYFERISSRILGSIFAKIIVGTLILLVKSGLVLASDGGRGALMHVTSSEGVVEFPLDTNSKPKTGVSTFDRFISSINAKNPKAGVPYPFPRLLKILAEQAGATKNISVIMFPFGRSLQRFAADPNFFKYPRVVVAVTGARKYGPDTIGLDMKAKLYFGYVESTNTLEVISFNEKAGRFEFQIVKNYQKGKVPTVYYAQRSFCLTCHHSEAPIFPGEPWTESNDNATIAAKIIQSRGGAKKYFGYPVSLKDVRGRGFSNEANLFDIMVSDASKLIHSKKMRSLICPSGKRQADCRGTALKVAMANRLNIWPAVGWQPLRDYRNYHKSFFKSVKQIKFQNPFLLDRDPFTNKLVANLDHHGPKAVSGIVSPRLINKMRSNILRLPVELDPRRRRERIVSPQKVGCKIPGRTKPAANISWCNTEFFLSLFDGYLMDEIKKTISIKSPNNKKSVQRLDFTKLEKSLDKMIEHARAQPTQAALSQAVMSSDALAVELLSHLKSKEQTLCCAADKLPAAVLGRSGVALHSSGSTAPELFLRYCGACHGDASLGYPVQFVSPMENAKLSKSLKLSRVKIKECMQGNPYKMPPSASEEAKVLAERPEDYKKMIEWLK